MRRMLLVSVMMSGIGVCLVGLSADVIGVGAQGTFGHRQFLLVIFGWLIAASSLVRLVPQVHRTKVTGFVLLGPAMLASIAMAFLNPNIGGDALQYHSAAHNFYPAMVG